MLEVRIYGIPVTDAETGDVQYRAEVRSHAIAEEGITQDIVWSSKELFTDSAAAEAAGLEHLSGRLA